MVETLTFLHSHFDDALFGFAVLDKDLRYLYINKTLAAMHGLPAADHIGRSLQEAVPAIAGSVAPLFLEALDNGKPVRRVEVSGEISSAPGKVRYWLEDFFPMRQADGKVIGVGATVLEVSEFKRMEKALEKNEERFRLIAEATNDVLWDWDIINDQVWWSDGLRRVLGYSSPSLSYAEWVELIHPGDRMRVLSDLKSCLESERRTCHVEYRFRRADGTYGYFADRFAILRDDGGRVGCSAQ
jgi:PAS domain S-box-containing protein